MNFGFTEEQELLRKTARGFLEEHAPIAFAREVLERGDTSARALWSRLAELGWTGLGDRRERMAARGSREVELCIVVEELGRSLAPVPFLPHAIATAGLQELGIPRSTAHCCRGSRPARDRRRSRSRRSTPDGAAAQRWTCAAARGGYRLRGAIPLRARCRARRPDPGAARAPASASWSSRCRSDTPGLGIRPMQATRPAASALRSSSFDGVALPADALLGGAPAIAQRPPAPAGPRAADARGGDARRRRALSRASRGLRARTASSSASRSASTRRSSTSARTCCSPCEAARSIVYLAAWAARERRADAGVLASMAKATAGDAYRRAAADNLQIHGGVGFTWEYDCHLYLRRARSDDAWFGSARASSASGSPSASRIGAAPHSE